MHAARIRTRPPESTSTDPAFDPMSSPAVIEAGKRLVSGRLTPREFDAVVAHERAVWERQAAGPGTPPPAACMAGAHSPR